MRAAIREFVSGPVGRLVGAVSLLTTLIAVAQFVTDSRSGWMWMFFGSLALVGLSFWRYYEMGRQLHGRSASALADRLTTELGRGDEIRQYFARENYPRRFTVEQVWGPMEEALDWASRVESQLREHAPEWLPEFRTAGYEIPPDPEPDWITVADIEAMLAARLPVLGRIIQGLRAEGRG